MHYGVKGMKWGVRRYQNEDGSLTNAGRKRLAKDVKKNTDYYTTSKYIAAKTPDQAQRRIANMTEVQELHKKLSSDRKAYYDTMEFARKFNTNGKLQDKYAEKAARNFCKDFGITDKDEINHIIDGYKYGDLDQGGRNTSFGLYCKDKNVDYDKYVAKVRTAEKKYRDTCKKYANELLKEYGSIIVGSDNTSAADAVSIALRRLDYDESFGRGLYIID